MKSTAYPPALTAKFQQAVSLHQRGEARQAAALYLEIVDAEPDHADALHLLGVFALQSGDLPAAHDLIGRAIVLEPRQAVMHSNFGTVLKRQGQDEAALQAYRRALALDPDDAIALNNCGSALLALTRYSDALPLFERALQRDPDYADALNNLGNAYLELRRHAEALLCLDAALRRDPQHMEAWFNRGNALHFLNRVEEAVSSYERALQLNPDHVDAHFNLGNCLLLQGELARGWPEYEWRWRKPAYRALAPDCAQPRWQGQALDGKTILVYAEQGYGDTLHLCRYVAPLAARGARVILRLQPALKTLLAGLQGVWQVLENGAPLPAFDYHCPLMSLPLACATTLATLPAATPYLRADPVRAAGWAALLGPRTRPRVGLAWAGSAAHANDQLRSMPLAQMRRLLTPAVDFISLQKDLCRVDRILLDSDGAMRQFAARQSDFAETAALIAQLDLVICVDTAIAHLAAALGKPVWILLPFAPDWRWMLERADSPWYPTARLFRQRRSGDWDPVLEEVARALADGGAH